jgi:two-component system cell cycle response regulator/two-component system cell cycle response regulator DivK
VPLKVLLVEDNELHMKLVDDLLSYHGFTVLRATTGARALVLAEENQPDIILMDLALKGMDGFEVTRALKQNPNTASIPVVALSAYAMPQDRQRAAEAGCVGFVTKPIDTRTFPALVADFALAKGGTTGDQASRQ